MAGGIIVAQHQVGITQVKQTLQAVGALHKTRPQGIESGKVAALPDIGSTQGQENIGIGGLKAAGRFEGGGGRSKIIGLKL